MKKLGKRNYNLIGTAVSTIGTYNPKEVMFMFEENLNINQISEIENFLNYCHTNNKTFGRGNYEEVFTEYLNSKN